MNILHLCLACFYIDGYGYQENIIPRINKEDGNNVKIIASTETYIDNNRLGYIEPRKYQTEYGVEIVRLPYKKVISKKISRKLRYYKGLYTEIELFNPDVIMAHDLSFLSVSDLTKYMEKHPMVRLYADTHTSSLNSGKNWISLHILHRILYKRAVQKALPYLKKYFYITENERLFSIKHYSVPEEIMEFLPLGGEVIDDLDYYQFRYNIRNYLGINNTDVVLLHSGKLTKAKRTKELIEAFSAVNSSEIKLIIVGSVIDDYQDILEMINKDPRVYYLGWKSPKELLEYLCATDVYCQPGSESSTMENAVCCRCAVMVNKQSSYSHGEDYGNLIWVDSVEDMVDAFNKLIQSKTLLKKMSNLSYKCACELLDYKKISARIYE